MSFYGRSRYRVSQFWRGLTARVSQQEMAQAKEILPSKAYERFCQLPVDAQRHSFNVLNAIHAQDIHDPNLDAAALLHDIGKLAATGGGPRLNLWVRGPLTLLQAMDQKRLCAAASSNPNDGWRYVAYVHLEHPLIGSEWAAADGCSELTCWLIRHHQDTVSELEADGTSRQRLLLLDALQGADNSS